MNIRKCINFVKLSNKYMQGRTFKLQKKRKDTLSEFKNLHANFGKKRKESEFFLYAFKILPVTSSYYGAETNRTEDGKRKERKKKTMFFFALKCCKTVSFVVLKA